MKDPAFLFYSSDFLTGITDLTMEERGQFITLLCIQHQKGHLTKKSIGIAVPNATADVLAKFSIDADGNYFNERLDKEKEKRIEYSEKQRQRALDGWKKRRATADATAMPLEDEDVNEDRIHYTNLYKKFVEMFNKVASKAKGRQSKFTTKDKKAFRQFISLIDEEYSGADFLKATENMFKDPHHRDSAFKWATPELITRPDKFEKFLNQML